MKLFYAIVLVLMVLVSACAQQTVEQAPEQAAPAETVEQPAENVVEVVDDAAAAEEEATAPEQLSPTPTANDVRILGKAGFEPAELTISVGSAVTWKNGDKKDLTLTIMKGKKFFHNSPLIKAEEIFELEFTEAGTYEYWSVAYGVKAKVVVE